MPRIVVVGSLHYDIMVAASDRPRKGETLVGRGWAPQCGGKGGNQAVAAARQGAEVLMVGAVGRDSFGTALTANLIERGVDCRHVAVRQDAASGMSIAISDDDGDYGAVIVSGANLTLGRDAIEAAAAEIAAAGILVLQNEIPDPANLAAARLARAGGTVTVLNAAPARTPIDGLSGLIDFLVVNALEAEMLGGGAVASLDHAMRAAEALLGHFAAVIVTAGGEGVAFADRRGARLALPAAPIRVESTHGAGDMFVGALAAALTRGESIETAIAGANQAAARLVATALSDR